MDAKLLKALQEHGFAALDLKLYIDTHPEHAEAISAYNNAVRDYDKTRMEFEKVNGPLFSFVSPVNEKNNNWIHSPWPWEREGD